MKYVLFVVSAYIMGILAAVPAGPVQIEVVRRSMNGHLRSSLMVVLGAMIADIAYGIIAFWGIAPFLKDDQSKAVFSLFGGMLLIVLGVLVIRQSLTNRPRERESRFLRKKRWGLISGFALSAANPMMILWWLIGAKLFMDINLIDDLNTDAALSFLASGGLGLASYLIFLSTFIFWAKQFISDKKRHRVNLAFGIILLFIAGYFINSFFYNVSVPY